MLILKTASLATVEELFRYKHQGFVLESFPGYSDDQWGIKAHNRPWIEELGEFEKGQRIIEVGGAYSLLPEYLARKYELEAWVGDDFGMTSQTKDRKLWSRWGDPEAHAREHSDVKYVFERFGTFTKQYPDEYFDRIFSVSTLEHIPVADRSNVFKDMHRCLKPGGIQLHTIDVSAKIKRVAITSLSENIPLLNRVVWRGNSEIQNWMSLLRSSGVKILCSIPKTARMLDRRILVDSPDVVYRFCPPNNEPKPYQAAASLLLIIEKQL